MRPSPVREIVLILRSDLECIEQPGAKARHVLVARAELGAAAVGDGSREAGQA
jgi:hypothetical protein